MSRIASTLRPLSFPTRFAVEVSAECNLACTYCFAEAGPHRPRMRPETARKAIETMLERPDDRFIVKLGGGEPLTALPLILDLMDYALKRNEKREPGPATLLFDITTNGTLLNDRAIGALAGYPKGPFTPTWPTGWRRRRPRRPVRYWTCAYGPSTSCPRSM